MWTYTPNGAAAGMPPVNQLTRLVGAEDEVERFEAERDLVDRDVEHRRDRPFVVLTDGEHATVEVLALDLDHPQEAGEHFERRPRELGELQDVDRQLGTRPGAFCAARIVGPPRQQLVDGDSVELRQTIEARQ